MAARLPSLVVAAKKVAQSVMYGVHGRRRAGPGENFWQFRPFISGEPAAGIDWRRSAREDNGHGGLRVGSGKVAAIGDLMEERD